MITIYNRKCDSSHFCCKLIYNRKRGKENISLLETLVIRNVSPLAAVFDNLDNKIEQNPLFNKFIFWYNRYVNDIFIFQRFLLVLKEHKENCRRFLTIPLNCILT